MNRTALHVSFAGCGNGGCLRINGSKLIVELMNYDRMSTGSGWKTPCGKTENRARSRRAVAVFSRPL